jgi:peptide deformylase
MAIHDIVLLGDPVLKTKASDVTVFDKALETLVQDMFETMYHAEGIGLAAPQIGISKRILIVDVRPRDAEAAGQIALVNPAIVSTSRETDRSSEGCLSIPGLEEIVERAWKVEVRAQNIAGEPVRFEAEALLARALQHEIDHLDGILFLDRVSPLKRRMLMAKWKKLREEAESEAAKSR